MGYDYDRLYRDTPEALGPQSADVAAAFAGLAAPLRVLDLGCGQGRDALPVARAGHSVTAVDLSPAGLAAIAAAARAEGLDIATHVADAADFDPGGEIDILLADRTLHMLPAGTGRATLARLLARVRPGGWLLLVDEPANMAGFRAVLDRVWPGWAPVRQKRGLLFARRPA